MPTYRIDWFHSHKRLILPVVVMAPVTADNPSLAIRTIGLIDTGATGTGIRADLAEELMLLPKGQRRVETANGLLISPEYTFRIGFIAGDYRNPEFIPDQQQPYVVEEPVLGFGLQAGFAYPVLIGMNILGQCDLQIGCDGQASLVLP